MDAARSADKGAAGVDGVDLAEFESGLRERS
jgi:hypothetical protein